jgi:hypothetical protein
VARAAAEYEEVPDGVVEGKPFSRKKKAPAAHIKAHSEADFSHGIRPQCAENLYPGLHRDEPDEGTGKEES